MACVNDMHLTKEYVDSLLSYDQDTGIFRWKVRKGGIVAGSIAGSAHIKGYTTITIDSNNHLAHRLAFLIMVGRTPGFVDHKNGNRNDNRWVNLRPATASENMHNMGLRKDNSSGVPGVYWNNRTKKWHAQFKVHGKQHQFGSYKDFADAVNAISVARAEHYGEFVR
ncbi:HNH endonuclease [Enterobacter kobei]|uniref:HNH endonuclease n=1 Tax=Enterobacter kobei TaxID=208224 RepID=UPI00159EE93D|nr:HNH endonuclease [Enterobacter kobei]